MYTCVEVIITETINGHGSYNKILAFQELDQNCLHRARQCNKVGVPDADIISHRSTIHLHHLSPVQGE